MIVSDPKKKRDKNNKKHENWPVKAFILTLVLALIFSTLSETTMLGLPIWAAVLVLCIIICCGIVFDAVGVAIAVQDETPYTAMASKRIKGAKRAIRLIQNADRASNICNDVIGDICGIVSGAMGTAIVAKLVSAMNGSGEMVLNIALSAMIAAVTVTGKALGKRFALNNSVQIVFTLAKALSLFERKQS